ncbi:MAG: hypothetical protein LQ348_003860 [Seirophora lacunosa]|nr:MAG: hypothetical protein LQ348_003860 [Seirophora lacunosa]
MLSPKLAAVAFALLTCLRPSHCLFSHQVDIRLSFFPKLPNPRNPVIATCINTAQGECCRPHEEALIPDKIKNTIPDYSSTNVSFTGLLYGQAGAGWGTSTANYEHIQCAGMPVVTTGGPVHSGREEVLRTPSEGQPPNFNNMAFAAAWVTSANGHVGYQRPRRWRHPNAYMVDGVTYWQRHVGVYQSKAGGLLNLRTMTEEEQPGAPAGGV